jgi:hypothetical protein
MAVRNSYRGSRMNEPDFYLASPDYYNVEKPRRVWCVKRMSIPNRDDLLLVKVDPPIVGEASIGKSINYVLLAARHKGASLFPISKWPTSVHVLRPLINDFADRSSLSDGEFESIAWAEVYPSEEQARRNCR